MGIDENVEHYRNIFQLYVEGGEQVPFIVSRWSWSDAYGMLVCDVDLGYEFTSEKPYGASAVGYPLPPLNGKFNDPYFGKVGVPAKIKSAGSYQWRRRVEVPASWLRYVE
jgi:hypothetical protein